MNLEESSRVAFTSDPLVALEEYEHRVANEYALAVSTVSLLMRTCDEKTRLGLEALAGRLRDQAALHRMLCRPVRDGIVCLSSYLADLSSSLSRAILDDRRISLTLVETDRVMIDAERAWLAGLVVMELITNSIRHAFGPGLHGAIRIEVCARSHAVFCCLSDNGSSAQDGVAGCGSRIISMLLSQLGGRIEKLRSRGGMIVCFSFSLEHAP